MYAVFGFGLNLADPDGMSNHKMNLENSCGFEHAMPKTSVEKMKSANSSIRVIKYG